MERIRPSPAPRLISVMARSNLYTMTLAAERDKRQLIPDTPVLPTPETRELRAKLILEEALETINALGLRVMIKFGSMVGHVPLDEMQQVHFVQYRAPDLEQIIDGCCDLTYVAIGTLCSCGVPDLPHMDEVSFANNAKFPKGLPPRFNESGKFLKPEGWQPPDHLTVMRTYVGFNLALYGERVVRNPGNVLWDDA